MNKARLEREYFLKIRPALQQELQISNIMEVPQLVKIVLNVGVKDAGSDDKALQDAVQILEKISGQKAVRCYAKKSIAAFKLREGMPIGAKVTLRRNAMYNFLDKLINLSLPRVRDFHGVSKKLDGRGGYNIGLRDCLIFPEISFDLGKKFSGMNITIQTKALSDDHGRELLKKFKMPFKN